MTHRGVRKFLSITRERFAKDINRVPQKTNVAVSALLATSLLGLLLVDFEGTRATKILVDSKPQESSTVQSTPAEPNVPAQSALRRAQMPVQFEPNVGQALPMFAILLVPLVLMLR